MNRNIPVARRLAGILTLAALLAGLSACGRENKILTPAPETTATWRGTIQHLFADRSEGTAPTGCTSCHHAGTGIPDWSSYHTVDSLSADIKTRLSDPNDTMRGFLKTGEPEIIINWIDAGRPF